MAERGFLPEHHAAKAALRGAWTLHRIEHDGTIRPPMPLDRNIKKMRRFDGGAFREAGKGESAKSFMAPGVFALRSPRVGAAIACAASGKGGAS